MNDSSPISTEDIDGLILAGGQSRRMRREGGPAVDKGLLELEGRPLVQWVAQYMQPWVGTLYVSANRSAEQYAHYGVCVADAPEFGGDAGPLAGVATVLAQVQRTWLFVLPVDVPRLPPDLAPRLLQGLSGGAPLAYANTAQGAHPLCMIVRRDLAEDLRSYLLQGGRKVLDWHRRHGAVPVDFGDDPGLFHNLNTPQDWQAAQ